MSKDGPWRLRRSGLGGERGKEGPKAREGKRRPFLFFEEKLRVNGLELGGLSASKQAGNAAWGE